MAFQYLLMNGAQVVSTTIVAPLGNIAIAANSFAITAESLCYMPGYGIGDAATTLIGQSVGARRADLCRSFAKMTVTTGMIVMALMGVVMYVFAPEMIGLLSPVDEIRTLGTEVLRIEAFAEPFFAAAIVSYSVCVGAGDTLRPSLINLGSMWFVRLTLAAAMAPPLRSSRCLGGHGHRTDRARPALPVAHCTWEMAQDGLTAQDRLTLFSYSLTKNLPLMQQILIKMISTKPSRACLVPETLDQFHILFIPLDHANWSGQYPYKPTVKFRISYVDDCILLHYVVTEESVAAVADDDGGRVWEDSCCEFFLQPFEDGPYYNFECNAAGKMYIACGMTREGRKQVAAIHYHNVKRWTSFGRKTFEEKNGRQTWGSSPHHPARRDDFSPSAPSARHDDAGQLLQVWRQTGQTALLVVESRRLRPSRLPSPVLLRQNHLCVTSDRRLRLINFLSHST